jgi:hypothetical protein
MPDSDRKIYLVVNQNTALMSVANDVYGNITLRGCSYQGADLIAWANEIWGLDAPRVHSEERIRIETVQDAVNACRRGGWMVLTQIEPTDIP